MHEADELYERYIGHYTMPHELAEEFNTVDEMSANLTVSLADMHGEFTADVDDTDTFPSGDTSDADDTGCESWVELAQLLAEWCFEQLAEHREDESAQ